ncbi:hypothetical protein Amsp01_033700 [Amycolatopsis sp. NBRC 101858]|uniref:hypothetical protein n=1 Tax=Amycolatopsis sp. NBRC 101858 TaxID=3032200 RepID=UPI0024A4E7CB|nr:hypothetical protein [Amycolatopsis sp. NBRC 101858]GLY37346.1 hypothetical protein Amsp01_033700 [Amycolatopsis sp. NBRC 101858]
MRTRLRHLHSGDRDYTWRATIGSVRGDGVDVHRCVRVRVWGAGKNGRALEADLLSTATSVGWTPAATDGSYPASGDVRRLVEHALALGWDPDARGGTFLLTEETGPELAGFLVTDRVRDPGAADPTARVAEA